MSTCRSCGALVAWAETEATPDKPGRRIPLDAVHPEGLPGGLAQRGTVEAQRVDGGNLAYTGQRSGDGTPIVRYVKNGEGSLRTHFATCPRASHHRANK